MSDPRCARCGATPLGVVPHVKWWQGVPTTEGKVDLCDGCHKLWVVKDVQRTQQEFVAAVKRLRATCGASMRDAAHALREHKTEDKALEALVRKGYA